MTMLLRREAPSASLTEIYAALERVLGDARRLLGDHGSPSHYTGASKGEYVDLLFRKVARVLDLLGGSLNTGRRRAARERGEYAQATPLELAVGAEVWERGESLHHIGLRRNVDGIWETDFLALEYALAQDMVGVITVLETFTRERLSPVVGTMAA